MTFNLPLYKNFGSEVQNLSPVLYNQLSEMYTDIANNLSDAIKRDIVTGANPAASSQRNSFFTVGDITVRTDTNTAWIMTSRTTPEDVIWTQIT
jgi:hypothetical protein